MEDVLGNQRHEQFLAKADKWRRLWGVHHSLNLPYLLSRGVQLSRSSYSQSCVVTRQLRRSIAFALLQANERAPSSSVRNLLGAPPGAPPPEGISRKRQAGIAAARAKKKRRRTCRVIPGGAKATAPVSSQQPQHQPPRDTLNDRKRKAKSLTDNPQSQLTIMQALCQPRKRARKRSKKIIICYL